MTLAPIDALPDGARIWIFGADRALEPEEEGRVRDELGAFLDEWTAHRRELSAGLDILHGHFLVVALDESRVPASGCSIDTLVHRLQELERRLDVTLTDGAPVWYRGSDGGVERASRAEFRARAERGEIGPETPVFDLTAQTLGKVRGEANGWERPASASWHNRLLSRAGAPPGGSSHRAGPGGAGSAGHAGVSGQGGDAGPSGFGQG